MSKRSKYWCFTLNNYTEADVSKLTNLTETLEECNFIVFQREKVTTDHLQGYIEFTKQVRLNWVKKNVDNRMHLEYRKGNQTQAIAYATKEESRLPGTYPYESGIPNPKSKKDTKLDRYKPYPDHPLHKEKRWYFHYAIDLWTRRLDNYNPTSLYMYSYEKMLFIKQRLIDIYEYRWGTYKPLIDEIDSEVTELETYTESSLVLPSPSEKPEKP